MIINKLKLKNFKSYSNTIVDFQKGINLIVGENGAGKSSILEAISFALFKKHAGVLNDLIKMDKNKDLNKKMSVSLEFQSDGVKYIVERERTKTSSKATLYIEENSPNETLNIHENSPNETLNINENLANGNKELVTIASGDNNVNKEIQFILNMDADLFLNAVYIMQGEIAELASKVPSEKKKLISKLLGIDSLEKAWKNSLTILNNYNERKIEVKTLVETNSHTTTELKDKKIRCHQLNSQKTELNTELKELKKSIAEKTNENKEMESEKSDYDDLISKQKIENTRIEHLRNDIYTLKKQLIDIENAEKEMKKLKPDVDKLPIYESFLNSYNSIKLLKEKQAEFEKQLIDIDKYNENLKTEELSYKEYKSLEKEITDLNERRNKIEGDLQLIAKDSKTKEELEKEINKDKQEINNFTKSVYEKLSIEAEDFTSLNEYLDETKTKIKNRISEFEDKLSTNNQKISTLNEKIRVAKKDVTELKKVGDKCPLCKSEISVDKRNHLNNSYNDSISENSKIIEDINKDIKKIGSELNILSDKLNEIDEIIKQSKYYENKSENLLENNKKKSILEKEIKNEKNAELELGKISTELINEKEKLETIEESKDKYLEAKGALNALEKPFVITNELTKVMKTIDKEVENIKDVMTKDPFLSSTDDAEELKNKIKDLKTINNKYQQLEGMITGKKDLISHIKSKDNAIDKTLIKIKEIDENIKNSKFNETKHKHIHAILDLNNKKIINNSTELGKIEGELNQLKTDVKNLEEKIKDNDKNKEELRNLDDFLRLLEDIRDLYSKDGIQKDLRAYSKPLIEEYTAEFFKKFNFSYSGLELDDDYNITVFGNNGETKLDMVSGGERISIALSLRFGISKAIAKGSNNTILLDEPTMHLDNYRRNELIGILGNVDFPQMIIVTHDNELENAADKVIKVEKHEGTSEIFIE
jgi:exonuclease SbcC